MLLMYCVWFQQMHLVCMKTDYLDPSKALEDREGLAVLGTFYQVSPLGVYAIFLYFVSNLSDQGQ